MGEQILGISRSQCDDTHVDSTDVDEADRHIFVDPLHASRQPLVHHHATAPPITQTHTFPTKHQDIPSSPKHITSRTLEI